MSTIKEMESEMEHMRLEASREDVQLERNIKELRLSRKEAEGLCLINFV